MEYNIGDTVTIESLDHFKVSEYIRRGVITKKRISPLGIEISGEMLLYCNKTTQIYHIMEHNGSIYYRLTIDNKKWWWDSSCFKTDFTSKKIRFDISELKISFLNEI